MSCFKIPKQVVDEITSELRRFWWERKSDKWGISWIGWNKLQLTKDEGGIGFKDLSLFNDSMLAKQAWRLLKHPNSLFARLFKAKYYPHCYVLEASSQRLLSYGWSSILVGLDLIKQGMKFNIGDGSSVRVFADNWLPTDPPRPALGDPSSTLKVNSLITRQNHTAYWNAQALDTMLSAEDSHLARSVFLSSSVLVDTPIWAYESNGEYSVRSGYHLARQLDPGIDVTSHGHGDLALKRRIWKIPILPNIQHFLWRLISYALPSATRLVSRGLNISTECSRCRGQPETISHLFFECPVSVMFWNLANLRHLTWIFNQGESSDDNIRMLFDRLERDDLSDLEKFMPFWVLWHIWTSRNSYLFAHKPIKPVIEVGYCLDEVKEWLLLSKPADMRLPISNQHISRWTRPILSRLKCNVDASRDTNTGLSFAGWLIRNNDGVVHRWGSRILGYTGSPLEAETAAMFYALRDILDKGFQQVTFESDCQILIQALASDSCNWYIYNLVNEIKLITGDSVDTMFSFVPRSANMAAHSIASSSRQNYLSVFHNPFLPSWLIPIVDSDIVNSCS